MEKYIIPAVLILGFILAAFLTRWLNWYTWGESKYRKDMARKRIEARKKDRKRGEGEDEQA